LYLFDVNEMNEAELKIEIEKLNLENQQLILVGNKADISSHNPVMVSLSNHTIHYISAKNLIGINELRESIYNTALHDVSKSEGVIVSNTRHVEQLQKAFAILKDVQHGLEQKELTDVIAFHLRHALHALAEITGEINHDRDILGTIFGKFCIGK
jgi:tRNA modification GTPase